MKTETEIREEIKATKKTIDNYRKAYNKSKIPKEVFTSQSIDCSATIDALRWVLGENDRYD